MRPPIVPCYKVQECRRCRRYVFAFQEFPGGGNRARKFGTSVHLPREDLLTQLAHVLATNAAPPVLKSDGTPGLAILALLARDSCHDAGKLRTLFLRAGHGGVGAGVCGGREMIQIHKKS